MTDKVKPLKIHVGKMGGVRVDVKEFFAQPEVQRKMKGMQNMDIVGKKLDDLIIKRTPKEYKNSD